ncbi:MAG: ABC transporter permease [Rhodothalassiaceae bacterium]
MRRILLVAWQEFFETLRSRTFLLGLVLVPAFLLMGAFLPLLLQQTFQPTRYVTVIDRSGQYGEAVRQQLERDRTRQRMAALYDHVRAFARPQLRRDGGLDPDQVPQEVFKRARDITDLDIARFDQAGGLDAALERVRPLLAETAPAFTIPEPDFILVDPPGEAEAAQDRTALVEALRPYLDKEKQITVDGAAVELYAALIIPQQFAPRSSDDYAYVGRGGPEEVAQLWTEQAADEDVRSALRGALDIVAKRAAFNRPEEEVLRLEAMGAPFDSRLTSKADGGSVTLVDTLRTNLPRILAIILTYFLIINLSTLMTNTMEEKSNRIIEVLMSSIRPNELLVGKLLGSSFVALLQLSFNVCVILGVLTLSGSGTLTQLTNGLFELFFTTPLLVALLFYFIIGFYLFSGIFVALGSLCESNRDVQPLMMPVITFLFVMMFLVFAVAEEPNSAVARILSYFPLTSPMMMMARINADPGWVDLVGSAIAQIAGIMLVLWLSAKIFRVGALRAGKPPKLREVVAAISSGRA